MWDLSLIEPGPPAVEAQSPNHWTAREFPQTEFLTCKAEVHILNYIIVWAQADH